MPSRLTDLISFHFSRFQLSVLRVRPFSRDCSENSDFSGVRSSSEVPHDLHDRTEHRRSLPFTIVPTIGDDGTVPSPKGPNQCVFVFATRQFRPMNGTHNSNGCYVIAALECRGSCALLCKIIPVRSTAPFVHQGNRSGKLCQANQLRAKLTP